MIEYLDHIDKSITIFLNQLRADFMDPVMLFITHRLTWIPFYVFLLFKIVYKNDIKRSIITIIAIVIATICADRISSGLAKPYFKRERPSHQEELRGKINVPGKKGGHYGFFSSHASNTFCLATMMVFIMRGKKYWRWLWIWATIVSYSRIYVGVHFFGDIFTGAVFGILLGLLFSKILIISSNKFTESSTSS